ncbi:MULTISPECIES: hypothetical protein, partial [unclassified Microcystis]|uniref:hypothetical protein n=1 Tax=unclassified Microcystis TaxID=2643300 RepID=UPI00257A1166
QQRVAFGVVGFRFFKRIELFSPQSCFAQPNPRGLDSQFQSMSMVRSPKSIGGAVEVALGNAPYGDGDRSNG